MDAQEILAAFGGGGVVVAVALVVLKLIQISPVKVNPWPALAKAIGKAINADVLSGLSEIKDAQRETRERLDEHIRVDDERHADELRARILQFDNDLRRCVSHEEEDYIEAIANIKAYETYCNAHPEYHNSRAVRAINDIRREYNERLEKQDFIVRR